MAVAPSAPSRRRSLPRRLLERLAVAGGWVGFVWLWWLVAARPWDAELLVWLIVGSFLIEPALTWFWVRHNRSIFERKGERRTVPPVAAVYERDWHGREIQADWSALSQSRQVVIDVDDACKRYRAVADAQPPDKQHSARPATPPKELA